MSGGPARAAPGTGGDPADRDARWDGSEALLVERLRDEIEAHPQRRMTFARFMERALTEPGLGYYATRSDRPTRGGDFLTAPELHPFFGRCLARLLVAAWEQLGAPERFTVREGGAGRGTLRDTTLAGLRAERSGLADILEWLALDLPAGTDERPWQPVTGVVLANELLDALPVHRVVQRQGRLLERFVAWRERWFGEVAAEPSTPALAAYLDDAGVRLAEGQRAEIGLAAPAWLREAADGLVGGLLLIIDYGHPAAELYGPRRMAGSLVTYRGHATGDDPFEAVGRQDITAHVDLTALGRAAEAGGLRPIGSTTQARFLAGLGLGGLLAELGVDPATPMEAYLEARAAVARFVDPRHLGAFRVLAWWRGSQEGPALPGLTD
jgi:SAM-dependent MidA family methyltransferase